MSPAREDAPGKHWGATAIYDTDCSSGRRFQPVFGRPRMAATAPAATDHDVEVYDRIVAVRDFLDVFAIGRLRPTESALVHLDGVLLTAGMHQAAADREREAAA